MKIEVNAKEMNRALKVVSAALAPRPITPTAAGIQIDAKADEVFLKATNGQYEICQRVSADVKEEGVLLVDGKRLVQMFGSMNGDAKLEENGSTATLKNKGAKFTMTVMNGELPNRPAVDKEEAATAEIRAEDLKEALENVKYAISVDGTRMELTGMLMQIRENGVTFVALDGFRMGVVRKA